MELTRDRVGAIVGRLTLTLTPIIDGPADGKTLVFIQGWPDDATMWDAQVAALVHKYRCVRVTMPNFGEQREVRWGYRTDEILDALAAMIREVSPDGPVTLIVHDWGARWGYAMHNAHPELANRVVGLDVAPHYEPRLKDRLLIIGYQLWLALAFLIGGPIGDWMTHVFSDRTAASLPRERINCWMNYPYRNIFEDLATGRARENEVGYWPVMPLLFVYGTRKPVEFHSRAWLDHLERVGGELVALEVSHWVNQHPEFTGILVDFLARTDGSTRAAAGASRLRP